MTEMASTDVSEDRGLSRKEDGGNTLGFLWLPLAVDVAIRLADLNLALYSLGVGAAALLLICVQLVFYGLLGATLQLLIGQSVMRLLCFAGLFLLMFSFDGHPVHFTGPLFVAIQVPLMHANAPTPLVTSVTAYLLGAIGLEWVFDWF